VIEVQLINLIYNLSSVKKADTELSIVDIRLPDGKFIDRRSVRKLSYHPSVIHEPSEDNIVKFSILSHLDNKETLQSHVHQILIPKS